MAYRWLGILLVSAACAVGCGNGDTGDPRGTGGDGGVGASGTGGTAGVGGSGPSCMTSLLCRSCPSAGLCTTDDCSVGFVCIESGCDSLEGAPIKHCVFGGGGACVTSDMCPPGRVCIDVPGENKRCVKTTPGCDTSFDCVPGFSCEGGSCVDRRLPCDVDDHCPKNHVCVGVTNGSFCRRVQIDCVADFDCVDLARSCEDIDGDDPDDKECAGSIDPNQTPPDACVNSECTDGSAPVCETAGAGSTTKCGQYGLCLLPTDCASGFDCVGLWPDGHKECVRIGGSCSNVTDCPVQQVCASPREGGPPSCQAGFQP
jgi:hypothetical protein